MAGDPTELSDSRRRLLVEWFERGIPYNRMLGLVVERIERYHTEPARGGLANPLFARHSQFRE